MGSLVWGEEEEDDSDEYDQEGELVCTKKPTIITSNFNNSRKRKTAVTTFRKSLTCNLRNYGFLPDFVITKISLFLPLKNLPSFFLSCKLFFQCSNSSSQWRERYKSVIQKKNINQFLSTEKSNWKKVFFDRYEIQQFRKYYRTKKYCSKNSLMGNRVISCFLGPPGVGKSSFISKVREGSLGEIFEDENFFGRIIFCRNSDNKAVSIEFWDFDMIGKERNRLPHPFIFKTSDIILICFALNDRKTFTSIINEVNDEITQDDERKEKPLLFLLGMKSDLREEDDCSSGNIVKTEEVIKFVKEKHVEFNIRGYVEMSSKTGENVFLAMKIVLDCSFK